MFRASADYYDLIYSTFKDYPAEARGIAALLRKLHPHCRSILDVACGTGEHARLLAADGFEVDGLDLDPAFVRIARQKHPAGRFFEADMSDFHLPHRYDAVVCLFSSIGYLKTMESITAALRCFREHLAEGGIVLVEPWFPPGVLKAGQLSVKTGEADGVRATRTSHLELDGRLSRILFDYEIDDHGTTRKASEVHELAMFTTEEMMSAFQAAGLEATHAPKGLTDRGMFVARIGT